MRAGWWEQFPWDPRVTRSAAPRALVPMPAPQNVAFPSLPSSSSQIWSSPPCTGPSFTSFRRWQAGPPSPATGWPCSRAACWCVVCRGRGALFCGGMRAGLAGLWPNVRTRAAPRHRFITPAVQCQDVLQGRPAANGDGGVEPGLAWEAQHLDRRPRKLYRRSLLRRAHGQLSLLHRRHWCG